MSSHVKRAFPPSAAVAGGGMISRMFMRSACALLLCTPALTGQSPSNAEREEARRQGEEQSRQQREREQQNIHAPDRFRQHVVRVEGKVLMAGGGPPPDRVAVQMTCGGQAVVARTFASANGDFSLSFGNFGGQLAGGTASGSAAALPSGADGCAVVADLLGFRAEPVLLEMHRPSANSTRVTLILKPIAKVSGYTFSGTSTYASKPARKAYEKGRELLAKNKLDDAERELRHAVELHSKYAVAWYDLGRVLLQKNQPQPARHAFDAAVAADPKYINPYPQLAQIALNEKRWEDVARHTSSIVSLNPFFSANTYLLSAQANLMLGRLDVAEAHAREAVGMDAEHRLPVAHRLLARILEKKGNPKEAIQQLQACLDHNVPATDAALIRNEIASLRQQISAR